ncbi:MAG: porphobilinogen synthase [Candidatus Omnitrophica bacterium]|nr:porphobilinogen synthase [Candidatus Omnitrophota bacterium]
MKYPQLRLRRLRESAGVRRLVQEHRLLVENLVQPLFVKEGLSKPFEVPSMPGQYQFPLKEAAREAETLEALGIPGIILFGIPAGKDKTGRAAAAGRGVVQTAIRAIKKKCPGLLLIADVCLCEYLVHGHCGRMDGKGRVVNDASLLALARVALSYAEAGADVVAPSDMMDGRVRAIRGLLDQKGFETLPILSYAVKYTSSFYAPFREAAENRPRFGDRSTYQMNPANGREALREAFTDLEEGADMLLVKPALGFGDVIREIRNRFDCPLGAFSVSGEYAMIKAASQRGWLDEKKAVQETHLGIKRAGADFIITYWAKELAEWTKAKS